MILPENNNEDLDNTNDQNSEHNHDQNGNHEHKKFVYKQTEDSINETQADNGDSSAISDIGRSDLINTPRRANKPLGSAHEPGTMPGSNNL